MSRRQGCEDYEPTHDVTTPLPGDNLKELLEVLRKVKALQAASLPKVLKRKGDTS